MGKELVHQKVHRGREKVGGYREKGGSLDIKWGVGVVDPLDL